MFLRRFVPLAVLSTLVLSAPIGARAQNTTYLALGDSVAFGRTDFLPVSLGDQGYVALFADWLGTRNGGVRPNVINLAISGEQAASFAGGAVLPGWPFRAQNANLHYPLDPGDPVYPTDPSDIVSQRQKMLDVIAAEQLAGRTITHVSFAVGANDIVYLGDQPAFQTATPQQQAAMLGQTLQSIAGAYFVALTDIRTALPDAQLLLPDYYNPFGQFVNPADPRSGANALFTGAALAFRNLLQTVVAPTFNGHVVDFYDPFVGNEAIYTNVLNINPPEFPLGDIHATPLGYSVMAGQMIRVSAAVEMPEPGTLALLSVGFVALLGRRLSRGGAESGAGAAARRRRVRGG